MQCNGFFSKIRYFVILLSREGFILSSRDKKKIDIIKLNEMKLSFCSQKKKISHIFFPESIVYIFFAESISTIVRVYIRFFLLISRFHFAPQNTWNTLYIRKQWSLVIMEKKSTRSCFI